jgi:hypothetical protein
MARRNCTVTVELTRYNEETDVETDLTVRCSVSPYDPGRTSGPPEDCYPPEGGEVESYKAFGPDGEPVELTSEEEERLQELVDEEGPDECEPPDREPADHPDWWA